MKIISNEKLSLNNDYLKRIEEIEKEENSETIIKFKIVNLNIWILNIKHQSKNGKSVYFESLNLIESDRPNTLVYNMQDGIVSGFELTENWSQKEVKTPSDFFNEIIYDLFICGWA